MLDATQWHMKHTYKYVQHHQLVIDLRRPYEASKTGSSTWQRASVESAGVGRKENWGWARIYPFTLSLSPMGRGLSLEPSA